jgi:hypothetical protein
MATEMDRLMSQASAAGRAPARPRTSTARPRATFSASDGNSRWDRVGRMIEARKNRQQAAGRRQLDTADDRQTATDRQ